MNALGVFDLLGIPFLKGGRDRAGMDCYGLVIAGCQRLGLVFPDLWLEIRDAWDRGERPLAQCMPVGWAEVAVNGSLVRGDVIFTDNHHLALAMGSGFVLHTTESTRSYLARERVFRGRVQMLLRKSS